MATRDREHVRLSVNAARGALTIYPTAGATKRAPTLAGTAGVGESVDAPSRGVVSVSRSDAAEHWPQLRHALRCQPVDEMA